MKIKTSELSGAALDYAAFVALHHPKRPTIVYKPAGDLFPDYLYVVDYFDEDSGMYRAFVPQEWEFGGPLLEEYASTVICRTVEGISFVAVGLSEEKGNTILEAFCRALVTERCGPEIDVPDELVREDKE